MSDASRGFREAYDTGDLSGEALDALTVGDIGAQIQAGLGITPDEVPASEVLLVTMMPDDSGSIRFAGAEQAMRDGHNAVLEALRASREKEGILAHTRFLNGHVLFPYRRLEDAEPLTKSNYAGQLGTPLFDQTAVILGTVLLKSREFEDAGVPARTITLILTDGEDAGSTEQDARSIAAIVRDMLRHENHIIAAMGICDGSREAEDRFRSVFREMGIPDEWVLTPANTEREIRAAFATFSQSALQASQSSGPLNQLGGFGS